MLEKIRKRMKRRRTIIPMAEDFQVQGKSG